MRKKLGLLIVSIIIITIVISFGYLWYSIKQRKLELIQARFEVEQIRNELKQIKNEQEKETQQAKLEPDRIKGEQENKQIEIEQKQIDQQINTPQQISEIQTNNQQELDDCLDEVDEKIAEKKKLLAESEIPVIIKLKLYEDIQQIQRDERDYCFQKYQK